MHFDIFNVIFYNICFQNKLMIAKFIVIQDKGAKFNTIYTT